MLIYEKNNKLNINFDNEISENPDLQIGKSGDKTEVLVDGSSNPAIPVPVLPEDVGKTIVVNEDGSYTLASAGSGGVMQVNATSGTSNKTLGELLMAYDAGTTIIVSYVSDGVTCKGTVIGAAGVYVDSKDLYQGGVTVARGVDKAAVGLTPFSMSIEPTGSEADALAAYPTLIT